MVLTRLFVIVLFVFLFFGDSFAHLFKERGFFCVILVFFNGVYDDFDVQNFALRKPVYDDRQVFVIVIVTHDIGVVRAMADTVLVLKNGKTVEYGTADRVLDHPRDPYTRKLLEAVPKLQRKVRV